MVTVTMEAEKETAVLKGKTALGLTIADGKGGLILNATWEGEHLEIQLYVCEHCGTKYKDKNECKKCESNHRAALEIHDMRFHACKDSDNYPDKVELKMADGKMIWYHR